MSLLDQKDYGKRILKLTDAFNGNQVYVVCEHIAAVRDLSTASPGVDLGNAQIMLSGGRVLDVRETIDDVMKRITKP